MTTDFTDAAAEYLTVNNAAALIDLTPSALRMRIHRGQIPIYRVAGARSIRLRRSDVLALVLPASLGGPALDELELNA